ncbi:hypothetical protein JOM56_012352 [Amanita muscaria]
MQYEIFQSKKKKKKRKQCICHKLLVTNNRLTMTSRELGYIAPHLYHILGWWLYQLSILFAYRFLYRFFSPGTKAYLQHEYKIVARDPTTLFICLRDFWLLTYTDESHSNDISDSLNKFSRLRRQRADTPSAAFLRIIYFVHLLPTSKRLNVYLDDEIQQFWHRGITGASKPDHFIFGGKWQIKDLPDPREKLGNDPLLCAIAASTAEQMVEVFNWRIGFGGI